MTWRWAVGSGVPQRRPLGFKTSSLCGRRPIPAEQLRLINSPIRHPDQRTRGSTGSGKGGRGAHTDGNTMVERRTGLSDRKIEHRGSHSLRKRKCGRFLVPWQYNGEFLASIARNQIRTSRGNRRQRMRDPDQTFVSALVPIFVIERFEAI